MLKDKIVFITGASSGIGTACANYFAKMGAKLLLCARRMDILDNIATQLQSEYKTEVHAFRLDIRHHAEVKEALAALPEKWKKIDSLSKKVADEINEIFSLNFASILLIKYC